MLKLFPWQNCACQSLCWSFKHDSLTLMTRYKSAVWVSCHQYLQWMWYSAIQSQIHEHLSYYRDFMTDSDPNQNTQEVQMNAIYSGLDKKKCKFLAKFAFDTAMYEWTNRCKTTDMSVTYLDAIFHTRHLREWRLQTDLCTSDI